MKFDYPAFPANFTQPDGGYVQYAGISLRLYLAGQALQGWLANAPFVDAVGTISSSGAEGKAKLAQHAIDMADALIAADRVTRTDTPSPLAMELERKNQLLERIRLVLKDMPELNMCNYDQEQVETLNSGMVRIAILLMADEEQAKET